jgi:hypothetical protein
MSKIIVVTTCPITKQALYVSDIKPGLLEHGARGDWGYSPKAEQAPGLTVTQADEAMRDMRVTGRKPKILSV